MSDEILKYIEEKYGKDSDNYKQMKELLIEMNEGQYKDKMDKPGISVGTSASFVIVIYFFLFILFIAGGGGRSGFIIVIPLLIHLFLLFVVMRKTWARSIFSLLKAIFSNENIPYESYRINKWKVWERVVFWSAFSLTMIWSLAHLITYLALY